MNRERVKGFIAGILSCVMVIALATTAFAAVKNVQASLEYKDIGVTLDGKKLDLKDAQGNAVEPFMMGGTNYLPVRALSDALGLGVSWDGDNNNVVLGSSGNGGESMYRVFKLSSSIHQLCLQLSVQIENGEIQASDITSASSAMSGFIDELNNVIKNDKNVSYDSYRALYDQMGDLDAAIYQYALHTLAVQKGTSALESYSSFYSYCSSELVHYQAVEKLCDAYFGVTDSAS